MVVVSFENSTKSNPGWASCTFCQEITERAFKLNVPVIERENFIVLADIAPVAPGHLIILPKMHCVNFAALEPAKLSELGAILSTLLNNARKVFEHVALAEHGSGREAAVDFGCVEHAHLHLCPVKRDPNWGIGLIDGRVPGAERTHVELADLASFRGKEYLLWGKGLDSWSIWTPRHHECSQLLRGVMNELNDQDASIRWQGAISREQALKTASQFHRLLDSARP